ncbi:hypothetical protein [Erythrobacter sp. HKB08]|uniref:hypothetical protein n=1 Tax=Erythrobacter sp. HKB08 TaxID=2502843 RepID=UPI0013E8C228|nr:hypothetical protein [Erythrobacter sp. HKB08]
MIRSLLMLAGACLASGCGAPDRSSGAWIGDMRICADKIETTRQRFDRSQGLDTLRIGFTPEAAVELRAMSEDYVDEQLPVIVNGGEIAAPKLVEPLEGTGIDLVGIRPEHLVDFLAYAKRPC